MSLPLAPSSEPTVQVGDGGLLPILHFLEAASKPSCVLSIGATSFCRASCVIAFRSDALLKT